MTMGGNCLSRGLGYHLGLDQQQVQMAQVGAAGVIWEQVCPWDEGNELRKFIRETSKNKVWGAVVAVGVWDVQIYVHHQ